MKKREKVIWQMVFVTLLIVGTIIIAIQQQNTPYRRQSGFMFGTVYHVTYQNDIDLKDSIEKLLLEVDASLSPFNDTSIISKINQNKEVKLDDRFTAVVSLAQKISKDTDGAFDITVAPLVNLWGFGFNHSNLVTPLKIDSVRSFVGYRKIQLKDGRVIKQNPQIMLDCSAIAKGYASDVIADFLRKQNIKNFMVEIGGEIVTSGISEKRLPWKIGVTKPTDDSLQQNQELQTILNLTDKALATSGNYRNFYYKDGKKIAHTIDPQTGYPVQHSILSATVIADKCAVADAYATAFMVMGIEKAKQVLERHPELQAYFIYSGNRGECLVWHSPSLDDKFIE